MGSHCFCGVKARTRISQISRMISLTQHSLGKKASEPGSSVALITSFEHQTLALSSHPQTLQMFSAASEGVFMRRFTRLASLITSRKAFRPGSPAQHLLVLRFLFMGHDAQMDARMSATSRLVNAVPLGILAIVSAMAFVPRRLIDRPTKRFTDCLKSILDGAWYAAPSSTHGTILLPQKYSVMTVSTSCVAIRPLDRR